MLTTNQIEQINSILSPGQFKYLETTGSTNDDAAQWAAEGVPDFSVVAANQQTAGRGRADHTWHTPPDSALAFSILLYPQIPAAQFARFTGLCAISTAIVLEKLCTAPVEIKYPNDVLIDRKKAAGILVETQWSGNQPKAVILGVGINVQKESVPPPEGLHYPATSIAHHAQNPQRGEILLEIFSQIRIWRSRILTAAFVEQWDSRLAFKGEAIVVKIDGINKTGRLVGLDEQANLIVEMDDGTRPHLNISEISVRPRRDSV